MTAHITAAQAKDLREAAREGPWSIGPTSDDPDMPEVAILAEDGTCPACAIPYMQPKHTASNAALIAAAPQLCLTVEALEAERDRLREAATFFRANVASSVSIMDYCGVAEPVSKKLKADMEAFDAALAGEPK